MLRRWYRVLAWLRWQRKKNDSVSAAAAAENLRRIPWLVALIVPIAWASAYVAWFGGHGMSGVDYNYRFPQGLINAALGLALLVGGVLVQWGNYRNSRLVQGPLPTLAWASLALGAMTAYSIYDQFGSGSVAAFLLASMFVGAAVLMRPAHTLLLFGVDFGAMLLGQEHTQADLERVAANTSLCLAASLMGLGLAIMAWHKHVAVVLLQRRVQHSHEELQRQHLRLEIQAQCDALTGLFNRREFARLANLELLRRRRHPSETSVIMADIDFFKRINDSYGHPAGDEVIKFTANALRQGVRKTDSVARMGGEEFIVLLPETSLSAARDVAEKLRRLIQESSVPTHTGPALQITASFGVTSVSKLDFVELDMMYAAADQALYLAKCQGRNRVEVCRAQSKEPVVIDIPVDVPSELEST